MSKAVVLSMNILTGHRVENEAGEELAKIEDLVLDDQSGRVLYAILSFGGFLGMNSRLVAVPWKRFRLKGNQKTFILNIDKETFHKAPSFDTANWPQVDLPEWRDRIESYFAYKPAEDPDVAEGVEFLDNTAPRSVSREEKERENAA